MKPRINIVQKLACTSWGCSAKTLKITTQAMVLSIAEYCSPVWMNCCHTKKVDVEINKALRVISGSVQSTPVEWLYILSNLPPPFITRQEAALRECKKIAEATELPIHNDISSAPPTSRLKSRKPFWQFYRTSGNMDPRNTRWKNWWEGVNVRNKDLITDPTKEVNGMNLPRKLWLRLNRIRTGHGCCAYMLHKWKFIESPLCECGEIQTMDHIVQHCNIHRFTGDIQEINSLSERFIKWLGDLKVEI